MSVIKPRTCGKELLRLMTKLDRENHETLHAYAHFLDEPTDYILNQLIETLLAKTGNSMRGTRNTRSRTSRNQSVARTGCGDETSHGIRPRIKRARATLAARAPTRG
jgi:hypothetical protein